MTSILAIETSTPACSVALLVGDAIFSRYSEEPRSHTRLIMTMIDEVLCQAGITVDDLDAIAVTVGPGSFTGLRIGFSTVQGLAYAANLPIIPVSTLQVMAYTYKRKYSIRVDDAAATVMAVLDARMGEFNCGGYRFDQDANFTAIIQDQLLTKDEALGLCRKLLPSVVIGDGIELLNGSSLSGQPVQKIYPDARDLLEIAVSKFARGEVMPVDRVELVYLRGTEAWKKHTPLKSA